MTMLRAGGLLDVLAPLSDCRHETVERIMERRLFGGFVNVLDGFPQRDFVLWIFMCPTNISLFRVYSVSLVSLLFSGYHAEGYHDPSIPHGPSRIDHHCTATRPVYIYIPATTPYFLVLFLSHLSYHAPPHT